MFNLGNTVISAQKKRIITTSKAQRTQGSTELATFEEQMGTMKNVTDSLEKQLLVAKENSQSIRSTQDKLLRVQQKSLHE